jgi:hypothetical protein
MKMVSGGYAPVRRPKNYAFGKVEEMGAGKIVQQVMIVGPTARTTKLSIRWNSSRTAISDHRLFAAGVEFAVDLITFTALANHPSPNRPAFHELWSTNRPASIEPRMPRIRS